MAYNNTTMTKTSLSTRLIVAIGAWLALSSILVFSAALPAAGPNTRAVILMSMGLILLWIVAGGLLMRFLRDRIRSAVQAVRLDWRVKFVLFATILALIEEAITVGMTNLAPAFGVPVGAAYITASANYLDVVCLHSVVVFIPMFIVWAWLLHRFDFSPNAVFLIFGATGMLAEVVFGGVQAFAEFALWIFIYGLMVYLPAYCMPVDRQAIKPRWWHYLLAVLLPLALAVPVAIGINRLHPIPVHFPPITPNS